LNQTTRVHTQKKYTNHTYININKRKQNLHYRKQKKRKMALHYTMYITNTLNKNTLTTCYQN